MSDEVIFALYHGDLMVDDPLPGLQASLEARGWKVTREAGALRVRRKGGASGEREEEDESATIAPRNSYATVQWIVGHMTYTSTKVGERRAAALRKRQFDACLQLFVTRDQIDDAGPFIIDLPNDLQETLSAWLYLRWNGRWLFPANEKPPSCFK